MNGWQPAWRSTGVRLDGCVEDGLGLWRAWSATDPDRYRVGECAAKWRGFDAEGGRTLGTFFWLAKRYGWRGCRRRGRRTGKRSNRLHPLLNARQAAILDILTALATPGKSGKVDHNGPSPGAGRSFRLLPRDDSAGFQTSEGLRICADRGSENRSGG